MTCAFKLCCNPVQTFDYNSRCEIIIHSVDFYFFSVSTSLIFNEYYLYGYIIYTDYTDLEQVLLKFSLKIIISM